MFNGGQAGARADPRIQSSRWIENCLSPLNRDFDFAEAIGTWVYVCMYVCTRTVSSASLLEMDVPTSSCKDQLCLDTCTLLMRKRARLSTLDSLQEHCDLDALFRTGNLFQGARQGEFERVLKNRTTESSRSVVEDLKRGLRRVWGCEESDRASKRERERLEEMKVIRTSALKLRSAYAAGLRAR